MTDIALLAVYIPMAAFTLGLIGVSLVRDRHQRLTGHVVFLLAMLFGWQIFQILYYANGSYSGSYWLHDLSLPFVALTTMALLLFTLRFYSLDAYETPTVVMLLCIIPLMTLLLVLTPAKETFLRGKLIILQTHPVHRASFTREPWFWLHTAYSYLCVALTGIIILVRYRKLPARYRKSSRWMLYGFAGSIAGNLLVLLQIFPVPLDFSMMGATVSGIFLFLAARRNHGLEFLVYAREQVFQTLEEAVFLTDDDQLVIRQNAQAQALLEYLGLSPETGDYRQIQAALREKANRVRSNEETGGMDYLMDEQGRRRVFQVKEKEIHDRQGKAMGLFVSCLDVTRTRALIERMEKEAGLDALTGLLNQRSMEQEQAALDTPEHLPLSVIEADINELKEINEQYGRQQGDMALRIVAEVLTASCPPSARVARVSDDEFRVILPRMTLDQLYVLLREIRKNLADHRRNEFPVTLAIGADVKTRPEERLISVLLRADNHMLLDKKAATGRGTQGNTKG